jgi:hypothetical protein
MGPGRQTGWRMGGWGRAKRPCHAWHIAGGGDGDAGGGEGGGRRGEGGGGTR